METIAINVQRINDEPILTWVTVVLNQITCVYLDLYENTIIQLSCGTKLQTDAEPDEILQHLN